MGVAGKLRMSLTKWEWQAYEGYSIGWIFGIY